MPCLHQWPTLECQTLDMRAPPGLDVVHSFLVLAEELNFRRSAKRLNVDQSALTRRIQRLEQRLGIQLLERTTRDVRLTAAGRSFYQSNTHLLAMYEASVRAARRIADGKVDQIRVAYMTFATSRFLTWPISRIEAENQDVELRLQYMRTAAQKLALVNGEIDVGYLLGAFEHPDFETIALPDERLHVVVGRGHPLATRDVVSPSDLLGQRLVVGDVREWGDYRRHLDELFAEEGVSLPVAAQTSHILAQVGLIASGLGVGVLPVSLVDFVRNVVDSRPFANTRFVVQQTVAWRSANKAEPLQRFVELVRQVTYQYGGEPK